MSTSVPAVDRAGRILRLLSEHAGEELRLSRIATALDIHKATCAAILNALADKGLVVRNDRTKTFSLGPRLISLGNATVEQFEGFREARLEMFGLATRLKIGCFVAGTIADQGVILDRVPDPDLGDQSVPPGWRMPLRPPFGTVFYAWSAPDRIDDWLHRIEGASPDELARHRRALAAVRARGYSIGGRVEFAAQLNERLQRLALVNEHTERMAVAIQLVDLLREADGLEPGAPLPENEPQYLIAPIFNRAREVVLSLTLFGPPSRFDEANLGSHVRALLPAARRVTASIGGAAPTARESADELIAAARSSAGNAG